MTNQYLPLILKIEAFLKGTGESINLPEVIDELRYEMIQRAIIKSGGNNTQAARMLGMQRTALLHYTRGKYKKEQMASDRRTQALIGSAYEEKSDEIYGETK